MEIKALNYYKKDYISKENFLVSGEVFIGPKYTSYC